MPVQFKYGLPWMDPAKLRHRVTFLKQLPSSDASGATVNWVAGSPPDTCWAEIAPMRAEDVIKGGQDVSQVRITVTTRYKAGRVPNSRLQTPNGSIFLIEGIQNVLEMNQWLVLTCLGLGANV